MAIARRGTTHLKAAELFDDRSKNEQPTVGNRSDGDIDRIFRRAPGDAGPGKGRPKSLKEALELPIPGFDVDLDELIGPHDDPPLPPPIDFSAPEYRE